MRYSKKEINYTLKSFDGKERKYKAFKMAPYEISKECFKIGKVLGTALGAAGDAYQAHHQYSTEVGMTFTALTNMIYENFEDEHFDRIQKDLMGSLYLVDINGETRIDESHFEEYEEDFLEIFWWLFKENIVNFSLKSGMFQSKIQTLLTMLPTNLREEASKLLNKLEQDTSEK